MSPCQALPGRISPGAKAPCPFPSLKWHDGLVQSVGTHCASKHGNSSKLNQSKSAHSDEVPDSTHKLLRRYSGSNLLSTAVLQYCQGWNQDLSILIPFSHSNSLSFLLFQLSHCMAHDTTPNPCSATDVNHAETSSPRSMSIQPCNHHQCLSSSPTVV